MLTLMSQSYLSEVGLGVFWFFFLVFGEAVREACSSGVLIERSGLRYCFIWRHWRAYRTVLKITELVYEGAPKNV